MRFTTGAIFCPSGIKPAEVDQICKRLDGGTTYDAMLAVVARMSFQMPYNHHMLYDRFAQKGPCSGGHLSGR